jgi:hypothetical protein
MTTLDYCLRESRRARRVSLRVTPEHGLEIVVPSGFNPARLPSILEPKRAWIRAALERIAPVRELLGYGAAWRLPSEIHLAALGRTWQVIARASSAGVRLRARGDTLEVRGRVNDECACRAALARWLLRQAREHLLPRLRELSARTGLRYRRAGIRRQRTRWGSCSRHGTISLNARLLFLDPALVDYVLLHELCHLRELNHSRRFWALVAAHDAGFRAHDRALREGWKRVPRWAG